MHQILEKHPELRKFEADINIRVERYEDKLDALTGGSGNLDEFANAHEWYGFHALSDGWIYREWAPAADQLYLAGDFNQWAWTATPMERRSNGNWELFLPGDTLHKGSRVVTIVENDGERTPHLPLYARRVVQDPETASWCCEVWDDIEAYPWTDEAFCSDAAPIIYEAHVGMSGEEYRVAQYREFADEVLPHIQAGGYNTIQLMGIMEHPYYGSFGYQVSNFYAVSSRSGLPEDLKYLINKAHSMGIRVLLDLVHSHAVKNTMEGPNLFDGTEWQFFHEGAQGNHEAWGTKLFNYDKNEVLHFLLSNLKFWLKEYHFDGFRFDGVTSMLYHDHGLGADFDSLDKYFTKNTDLEAITYLQLANTLTRQVDPEAMTIAEDMSGMPGMCEAIEDGGIGFDYRLGMGLPDMWIKLIKNVRDEDWNLGWIWKELTFRNAPTIAYAESHDQALVGDQTILFRLAGSAMYTEMDRSCHTFGIDRATALHKMIRLITLTAGGSGYLNFMGNEFGHPEWIDFPREGNGWSHHYARRQWSLLHNGYLKYELLGAFDRDMIHIAEEHELFREEYPKLTKLDEKQKVLAYERGGLVFVFNLHPTNAYYDCRVPVSEGRDHKVLFTSDDACYGGFDRIDHTTFSAWIPGAEGNNLSLFLPPRTCMVLEPVSAES